jgi:[ribosomal protein S5]-alanine N-acetyltransferase
MAKPEAPTLETARLVLRRKTEDDIPHMVKMFNTDEVRRYLGGYPPRDEHAMLKMVRHRKETQWAVTIRDTGAYIGECLIPKIVDNYLGEIGYLFMREHWGKGYAQEAVTKVIDHCFNTLKLKRLFATIDDRNDRSKKLTEKLGFKFVALLPRSDFGGRVADVAYYDRIQ